MSEQMVKDIKAATEAHNKCDCSKSVFLESKESASDKTIVFYGEPSCGLMDIMAVDNRKDFLFQLAKISHHSNFRFITGSTGRMLVQVAREMMAEQALKLDAKYVLFVDDDMIVPKRMFEALMKHADKADIIAPICFQRISPYKPVIYKTKKEIKDGKLYITNNHITDYEPNSIVYPDAVGFGVVLINTEVFKKLPQPWFFSNTNIGEDIYFCQQAKAAGFNILVDTSVKVGHLAMPEVITEREFALNNETKLSYSQDDKEAVATSESN